jgi:hypothetical protein
MLQWFRDNPWLARLALFLNLAGAILLALSFSATSSDFRLITARDTDVFGKPSPGHTAYAICANNYTLAITDSAGGLGMGIRNCPNWDKSYPAALVIADHPVWLQIGLALAIFGFLIQLLTVATNAPATPSDPLTRAEWRRVMKDRAGS